VSLLDGGSPVTPVMLVVAPPSRLIEVSLIGQFDNAQGWQGCEPGALDLADLRAGHGQGAR
jgi:hypothetical protein